MNITKLVASLQKAANTSTTAAELANLSRAIKGLNVGTVTTVANTASLPAMLPTNGNLYYVESEEDLYYNVGGTWNRFYTEIRPAYAWGYNGSGQLGDSTTSPRSSPVTVIGSNVINWSQVSAGSDHSLGLTATGIAYAWGNGQRGQLGDGASTNRSSPVTVAGGITNWSQVSAGRDHSLGLTATGIAYAWGYNLLGYLGDGTSAQRPVPTLVVGGITNWRQLSAGNMFSLGLTSTGIAYAWGYNNLGRLGDGTTIEKSSPVTVVGGITNWRELSAGSYHGLGTTNSGLAYAWGRDVFGNLGNNILSSATSSPATVVGGITNWSKVSAGRYHSLGLTSTGIAYAWGRGQSGQLGDGTAVNKSSPVTVVGGITNWSQLSCGSMHSLGLTGTGIIYVWGYNSTGRLGDGTSTDRSSPVTLIGSITNWTQISAGARSDLKLALSSSMFV